MVVKRLRCMFCVNARHILPIGLSIQVGIFLNLGNYIPCIPGIPCSLFAEFCFSYGSILGFQSLGDNTIDLWLQSQVLSEPPCHNSFIHTNVVCLTQEKLNTEYIPVYMSLNIIFNIKKPTNQPSINIARKITALIIIVLLKSCVNPTLYLNFTSLKHSLSI